MLAITTLTSTEIPTGQQPDGPANECPKRDVHRDRSWASSALRRAADAVSLGNGRRAFGAY